MKQEPTGAMRKMLTRALISALLPTAALAHDDRRFAGSPLKPWFQSLGTKAGGLCCALADGILDVTWGTTPDGHYRVHVWGQWVVVPDEAVVQGPNRLGRAVVWPYIDDVPGGTLIQIKCFLPGEES